MTEMFKEHSISNTVITQMLRPSHGDSLGIAYGGTVLAWIDLAAGICAKRHCCSPCVTASVDSVHFLHPLKIGDMCVVFK